MALTISLDDKVWIHDPDDLSVYVAAYGDALDATIRVNGRVGARAGGRRRATSTPGRDGMLRVQLDMVSTDVRDQLEEWTGLERILRDPRGRVWWGVWWTLDVREMAAEVGYQHDLMLMFERTTGTAEV